MDVLTYEALLELVRFFDKDKAVKKQRTLQLT